MLRNVSGFCFTGAANTHGYWTGSVENTGLTHARLLATGVPHEGFPGKFSSGSFALSQSHTTRGHECQQRRHAPGEIFPSQSFTVQLSDVNSNVRLTGKVPCETPPGGIFTPMRNILPTVPMWARRVHYRMTGIIRDFRLSPPQIELVAGAAAEIVVVIAPFSTLGAAASFTSDFHGTS